MYSLRKSGSRPERRDPAGASGQDPLKFKDGQTTEKKNGVLYRPIPSIVERNRFFVLG